MSIYTASTTAKMLKKSLVLTMVVLFPLVSISQSQSFDNVKWKQFRNEVYGGVGATAFLGDLGGSIESGKHSLKDLNIIATNYAFSFGLRVKLSEYFTVRGDFTFGSLSGADSLTDNLDRKSRNLSFKSQFMTLAPIVEFYVLPEEFKRGGSPFSAYVATGIRFMYFNPQAEYNGEWYDLQPLGTEGQLLASGGGKAYSKYTIVMPAIVGFKYALNSEKGGKSGAWTFGLELSANWTLTDYIDDVSSSYTDPEAIRQTSGAEGVYFADRRLNASYGSNGGIRGNSEYNDWYGTIQIIVGKQLYSRTKRRGSKHSKKSNKRKTGSTY